MTRINQLALAPLNQPAVESKPPRGTKLHDAAVEFESLLIGDMLRSARESGCGWMGGGEDQAAGPVLDLAEQHFAKVMAAGGGLGVAKLITEGLAQAAGRDPSAAQPSEGLSCSAIRSACSGGI